MPSETAGTVLSCSGVGKTYRDGHLSVAVLNGVDLQVVAGERIAVIGSSGSGKSTLLNILGGLDRPSEGRVELLGRDINRISEGERCRLRNRELGFVYQFHHLLHEFTAAENVAMPLLISGAGRSDATGRAVELLGQVGVAERAEHKPGELSGGERQRVAIARALAMEPACVLMDEPTGNLDVHSAGQVLATMDRLAAEVAASFIVVTHDQAVARHMDRVLALAGGTLTPC